MYQKSETRFVACAWLIKWLKTKCQWELTWMSYFYLIQCMFCILLAITFFYYWLHII